jgi:hypothetical protein
MPGERAEAGCPRYLHASSVLGSRAQLTYRDALNAVSRYAFTQGKLSNQEALQRACYEQIRTEYGLPAQMACNVPRQVGAPYRALWTMVRANTAARAAGRTKKTLPWPGPAPEVRLADAHL